MKRILLLSVSILGGLGCQGVIADPSGGSGEEPPPRRGSPLEPPTRDECEALPESVGDTPLRRLTREQYENTVHDLLEGHALPASFEARLAELTDGREGGFASTTSSPGTEITRTYIALAEEVAASVRAAGPETLLGCAAVEPGCVRGFVERFGRRAFRRPLDAEEVDGYVATYDTFASAHGDAAAFETLLAAMLASPRLVYLAEPLEEARAREGIVALDGYAIASRLSYFLWASAPDEALLDAAAAGSLDTADGIAVEARRMVDDPKMLRAIDSFHEQWLELESLDGLANDDPAFTDALPGKMRGEATALARHVMTDADGRLGTLLTAPYTFGDDELAALYGSSAGPDGRIELDPAQRAGLLTQLGFLTRFGQIYPEVHRGRWVRAALLCDLPPPPPPEVPDANSATRLATEPCVGCHVRMDPIGFGFADYDSLGRFDPDNPFVDAVVREPEVIDPEGRLDAVVVGTFGGARELAERLAESEGVRACVATQWFRYATGRWERREDACGMLDLTDAFERSGGDLRELVVEIATSPAFRSRSTDAFEATEAP